MYCIYVVFLLIFNIYLIPIAARDAQNDVTTLPTPTSTLQRSIAQESESLTKRDVKETDLSSAKSYDPPPEFYRGPGTAAHVTATRDPSYYNNNYKPYNSFKSRPIAFPDNYSNNNNNNYSKYNGAVSGTQDNHNEHSASSYNSWQQLKGKVGTLLNKKDILHDRISVAPGHYGTSELGSSTNGGYAYEGRPYGDYVHTNPHYDSSVTPSAHTSGYYGGSAAADGIPFDVYGGKNHYSGSAGNDYTSFSYSDIYEPAAHKTHPDISQKALLAKSFLIPLASAAVLGIAAALVSNPLLLQLGTVSGVAPSAAILGKRKRRDLTNAATSTSNSTNSLDLALISVKRTKKDSKLQPYRGHQQQQKQFQRHRHFVRT